MTIKKKKIKGKFYYYLEKNLRIGENKWKTFSVYLGSKKPARKELGNAEKKLNRKLNLYIKSSILRPNTKFIDKKTALLLERIKTTHKKLLEKLDKKNRAEHTKRQRETFITNTNAIEGSRLTLEQTKKIMELKEKYESEDVEELEVINMENALDLYDKLLEKKVDLTQKLILSLHMFILKTIPNYEKHAGSFRTVNVYIRSSKYYFPDWKEIQRLMSELLLWYNQNKDKIHPVELAAIFHAKFVTIHPFADGNGRMARLLMNYILQLNRYPFIDIEFSKRDEYFKTQEEGHFKRYKPFVLFLINQLKTQFKKFKRKIKN